jgi:hypothetical protein
MTKKDIADLRARAEAHLDSELAQANAKYKRRMDALDEIELMLPAEVARVELGDIAEGPSKPPPKKPKVEQATVIDSVRAAVFSSPNVEWSTGLIESYLISHGFAFTAKDPKSTINTALTRLAEQGYVRVVSRGSGRRPSLYKPASDRGDARSENPNDVQGLKDAAA